MFPFSFPCHLTMFLLLPLHSVITLQSLKQMSCFRSDILGVPSFFHAWNFIVCYECRFIWMEVWILYLLYIFLPIIYQQKCIFLPINYLLYIFLPIIYQQKCIFHPINYLLYFLLPIYDTMLIYYFLVIRKGILLEMARNDHL